MSPLRMIGRHRSPGRCCYSDFWQIYDFFCLSRHQRREKNPVPLVLCSRSGTSPSFCFRLHTTTVLLSIRCFPKKNAPILFPLPMPRSGRRCRDKFTCKTGVDFLLHFSPSPRKKTCLVRKTCDAAAGEGEGGRRFYRSRIVAPRS